MTHRFLLKIAAFFIVGIGVSRVSLAVDAVRLKNPLKPEYGTISAIVGAFLRIVTQITLPIITLFIIYSGYLFVTARGNETKITQAKRTFTGSVIGAAIIVGAWAIAGAVNEFAKSLQ